MFLAGADGQTPELRPPSIKGALRFWWRAINGHLPLEDLRTQERAIFGDTTRRSKVVVRTSHELPLEDVPLSNSNNYSSNSGGNKRVNILEYLAYGVVARSRTIERAYFATSETFDVCIKCPFSLEENLKEVFELVSLFGGIGSRSRNGYGSFSIQEPKLDIVEKFKKYKKGDLQNYTSFSEKARLFLGKENTHDSWEGALFEVGDAYRTARLGLEGRHYGSQRKMISQPLSIKAAVDNPKIKIHGKKVERNAKCFFIGVKKEKEKYRGHILYLPHNIDGLNGYLRPNDCLANHLEDILKEVK